MSDCPDWLPEIRTLKDYDGDWATFEEATYKEFCRCFLWSRPSYQSLPVVINRTIEDDREIDYWHVISTDDPREGERLPDLRRCERIGWIRAIIENASDEKVSVWEEMKKGEPRIYLWLESQNYVVVLARRTRVMKLITAFYVDRNHTREGLMRARERAKKQASP